jgi:hypothetical protein
MFYITGPRFHNKPVPSIVDHKHINFDKHSSLLKSPYILNLGAYSQLYIFS